MKRILHGLEIFCYANGLLNLCADGNLVKRDLGWRDHQISDITGLPTPTPTPEAEWVLQTSAALRLFARASASFLREASPQPAHHLEDTHELRHELVCMVFFASGACLASS